MIGVALIKEGSIHLSHSCWLLPAAIQPVPVPSGPKTSTKPLRSSLLDISPSPDVKGWPNGSMVPRSDNSKHRIERLIFQFSSFFLCSGLFRQWVNPDCLVWCTRSPFLASAGLDELLDSWPSTFYGVNKRQNPLSTFNEGAYHTSCKEPSWTKDPKTAPTADSIDFFIWLLKITIVNR